MSQVLVHKLGALMHMTPLLKSPNRSLQKTALSLMGNMSRNGNLQSTMGKEKHAVTGSVLQLHNCLGHSCRTDLLFPVSSL